ncbi:MAG: hypothetical protein LCH85_23070 [Chloroflexi bacterium]|nr:hypothetical protein [Chloroflexota bacterium]
MSQSPELELLIQHCQPTLAAITKLNQYRDRVCELLQGFANLAYMELSGSLIKHVATNDHLSYNILCSEPAFDGKGVSVYYELLGALLKEHWSQTYFHALGWRIPFEIGMHIDVIYAQPVDHTYTYFKVITDKRIYIITNFQRNAWLIAASQVKQCCQLLHRWRHHAQIPFTSGFLLELAIVAAADPAQPLAEQCRATWRFLVEALQAPILPLRDPTNQFNQYIDDLTPEQKSQIIITAQQALTDSEYSWDGIFGE